MKIPQQKLIEKFLNQPKMLPRNRPNCEQKFDTIISNEKEAAK